MPSFLETELSIRDKHVSSYHSQHLLSKFKPYWRHLLFKIVHLDNTLFHWNPLTLHTWCSPLHLHPDGTASNPLDFICVMLPTFLKKWASRRRFIVSHSRPHCNPICPGFWVMSLETVSAAIRLTLRSFPPAPSESKPFSVFLQTIQYLRFLLNLLLMPITLMCQVTRVHRCEKPCGWHWLTVPVIAGELIGHLNRGRIRNALVFSLLVFRENLHLEWKTEEWDTFWKGELLCVRIRVQCFFVHYA